MLIRFVKKLRGGLSKVEPYWTLVGAPISQEVFFRFLPYVLFYNQKNFLEVGLLTSLLFALTHWYFGRLVIVGSFFAGMVYWWTLVNFGLLAVIFIHSATNMFILCFWKDKWLNK